MSTGSSRSKRPAQLLVMLSLLAVYVTCNEDVRFLDKWDLVFEDMCFGGRPLPPVFPQPFRRRKLKPGG